MPVKRQPCQFAPRVNQGRLVQNGHRMPVLNIWEIYRCYHCSPCQNICSLFLSVLFIMYFPTASVGYFMLGDCMKKDMLSSMNTGPMKKVAQAVVMAHLIAAVPIVINPPSQFFEELMENDTSYFKKCLNLLLDEDKKLFNKYFDLSEIYS